MGYHVHLERIYWKPKGIFGWELYAKDYIYPTNENYDSIKLKVNTLEFGEKIEGEWHAVSDVVYIYCGDKVIIGKMYK